MLRRLLPAILLLAIACSATTMRWQKPGVVDSTRDEVECRDSARQEAARRLPYGDGPPIFVYRTMSMLQWTQAIDNERSWLAEGLAAACMRDRGFELVSIAARQCVKDILP